MTSRSFHCVGLVIGVTLLLDQTPCRSGCPSAVRGTLYDASAPYIAPAGNFADCAVNDAPASPTATRNAPMILTSPSSVKDRTSSRQCAGAAGLLCSRLGPPAG